MQHKAYFEPRNAGKSYQARGGAGGGANRAGRPGLLRRAASAIGRGIQRLNPFRRR